MASVAASNRAVSATVLLALLVSGWCVAMASAVPAANGRRLQQLSVTVTLTIGGLETQLQALAAGLQKLSDQLQSELQIISVPADLLAQLQQVATCFATAQGELQNVVQSLLSLPTSLLDQADNLLIAHNLLILLATKLQEISLQFQNPQPDADGCFKTQQAIVVGSITELVSEMKSNTAGLPISLQPLVLIVDLQNLETAVGQVNPCAAGLGALPSNAENLVASFGAVVAAIQ
ncbi:unnamed protein product [Urochloa humidicola]